jgi:hypothetical protein
MNDPAIRIVAALIRDADGRVLLVRKRGTAAFMHLAPLTRDHVLPLVHPATRSSSGSIRSPR